MPITKNHDDTSPMPADGWICFHGGERFTKPGAARDHFGETPAGVAGGIMKAGDERGLLLKRSKAAAESARLRSCSEPMQQKASHDA